MKNWFAKLFKYEKSPLAISQGTSFHTTTTGSEEIAPEDVNRVSSSTSIPIEDENPPSDSYDKETRILFEAFKNLTPEYSLVIAEMRNLLDSEIKRIVFHALATRLSIDEVATHLGLPGNEVYYIYLEAIKDIHDQAGFVKNILDKEVRKENTAEVEVEVDKQKPDSHSQQEEATKKALLSKPLNKCLDVETRTLTTFKILGLYTLEDLLQFASDKGLNALTNQKNFGRLSLNKLTNELIRKEIFNKNGSCDLYKYMSTIDKEEA